MLRRGSADLMQRKFRLGWRVKWVVNDRLLLISIHAHESRLTTLWPQLIGKIHNIFLQGWQLGIIGSTSLWLAAVFG